MKITDSYIFYGVKQYKDSVIFSVENTSKEPLFLVLTDKDGNKEEIPFDMNSHIGMIYYMEVPKSKVKGKNYLYRIGRRVEEDAFAPAIEGTEKWGEHCPKGCIEKKDFEWGEDIRPDIPFKDMILYHLHVRGFTMHRSSKVKHKGTFEGIAEKCEYLKELGVNAIELMPCYDFNEELKTPAVLYSETVDEAEKEKVHRYNYWGFTDGFYMAPKNAYAAKGDGITSFCQLVKKMHENGILVFTDFFFGADKSTDFIKNVIRKWTLDYHVDGFRVVGPSIPAPELANDPLLADIKLIFDAEPEKFGIHMGSRTCGLAALNAGFMYENRKFLKSDDDMLKRFVGHMLSCPDNYAEINYMADYCGFTLNDVVSYDEKHNFDNGEHNADGNDYNYSWNCGAEGPTRRKSVINLRSKQLKNAFVFLLLAQGTPEILAGDEFMNSQLGNNNAYCQDNVVSWLNWNDLKKNRDHFEFVKELIAFRKKHKVFHSGVAKRMIDYRADGFPDVSLHGEQAWAPRLDNFYRHVGIMYNGEYCGSHKEKDDTFFVAFNMHWQNHRFALPKPPAGMVWKRIMTTSSGFNNDPSEVPSKDFLVEARSVRLLKAVAEDKKKIKGKVREVKK